jgi:hypothetical protein
VHVSRGPILDLCAARLTGSRQVGLEGVQAHYRRRRQEARSDLNGLAGRRSLRFVSVVHAGAESKSTWWTDNDVNARSD